MKKKKRARQVENKRPKGAPRPVEIEDLEQPDTYEDRQEIKRLFADQIREKEKDSEFMDECWEGLNED
jgi:hypothetical protein